MLRHRAFNLRSALIGAVALAVGGCASSPEAPPRAEGSLSLQVQVSAIACCQGALHVALYNSERFWLADDGMVRGQVTPVVGAEQIVEFAGLPEGHYAVAAFQDRNGNARLERFLGLIPREPYGFSGDEGGFRPPSFADAAIDLNADAEVGVTLRPPPF